MKRWLSLTAAALCLSASAPVPSPANYDAFGITLLQRLAERTQSQNVVISPLSIGVALAMAADGANGETRNAILRTLQEASHRDLADSNAALIREVLASTDATISLADAIWLRADNPPFPSYVALLNSKYHAEARAVHFGDPRTADQINRWVKGRTFSLIDHLIDRTDLLDFAYLTNALAFQAKWALPFKKQATQPHDFTNADGTKTKVQMMSQVGNFRISRERGYRTLRMDYGRGGFAAYIILPDQNNARALLSRLSKQSFDRAAGASRTQYTRVSIPRFTARFEQNLNDPLIGLGMGIAFSPLRADFTRIHRPRDLCIANVEHASYVRVDEAGTTAAAATSVEITLLAAMPAPAPPPFTVDHPFIFAIRDEHASTLLFIGIINKQ